MNNHPAENEAVGAVAIQADAPAPAASQLITLDPAKYVAEVFKPFIDKLAILKAEADAITPDASTTAGMDICIKYRAAFRDDVRIAGEKARVERKAPILIIGKLLDTKYAELKVEVAPYEAKFDGAIEAEKKRKEELKAAEAARAEQIRLRIAAIRELPLQAVGQSAEVIAKMSAALEVDEPDEAFGAMLDAAKVARAEVLIKLAALHVAATETEAEAARIAAERAELAQLREAAAEAKRIAQEEADRVTAERQAEDQRRAALVAEQEAAALRQREAQAAELKKQADAQAERNRLEQAEIARQRQELLDMQADAKAKADAEAARLVEAAAQAERDRVAADTKRQLDQQAADTAAARAAALVEQGRLADLADQPTSMAPADELADAKASPDGSDLSPAAQDLFEQEGAANFERAHTPPTLRLGQISDRLGFTVTASFMESLGFAPAATDKAAKLYHEADFKSMCAAICRHISAVQIKHAI
ncbi:hypothetical protein [Janthinobacterium sp.]|uniref:hypothetical protein n=1 Tax=Janthinobacterium sp. TaxID=1871054 RepID=UPI00289DA28A|nr:hypothetical protein [Janthinobacterium sp.]